MKFRYGMRSGFLLLSSGMVLGSAQPLAFAQQPTSAVGMGTVTGRITCGDTQRPARFAHVVLFGVPTQVTASSKPDPNADAAAQMAAMAAAMKSLSKTNMVQAQTGTNGEFIAPDVAPGDYYLFAATAGYVSPLNEVQAIYASGADMKKPLPGVPVIHVTAEHTSMADLAIQRGAAVSGTISWDDGSPVTGAVMAVEPAKGEAGKPPTQFTMLAMANILGGFSISDDLGHFRVSGLAPGEYVIKATVQSGQQGGFGSGMNLSKMMAIKPLVIYAPAAFHKTGAKAVTLHDAEDLRDLTMALNLSGLHTVSGRVTSAEDRHGINSGTVQLQDTVDKDFVRAASLDANGGFTATYVPAGTYTMKVTGAEDTEPEKKKDGEKLKLFTADKTLRSYKDGTLTVVVTDVDLTGQNLELLLDRTPKKEVDFSKLLDDDDEKPAPKP